MKSLKYSLRKKILNTLGVKSARTENIIKHIGWSMLYKSGSIVANFSLVPLTINYLDTVNYGVWLTLSSFISWFSFFDIGLGNGLKNKFAEAKSLGNHEKAKAFVSTAYLTISAISCLLIIIFLIINQFIDWTIIFNTSPSLKEDLAFLLPIVFLFFTIQLVLKLVISIYQGNQHHSIQAKTQFFVQLLSLLAIYFLIKRGNSSLLLFGSVISALPVLILLIVNIIGFTEPLKHYRPKYSLWRSEYFKEIAGLGLKFFVLQVASLVLFTTDNIIISQLFGPDKVVPYHVAHKYFSIISIGYAIILTPYWSAITEAYTRKDFSWIKTAVNNIQKIWLFVPVVLVVMIAVSNRAYIFWVGQKVSISVSLTLMMALLVALKTFNMVYVSFINGVGKIKLQLITGVLSILLNVPLSIFFAKYLDLGVKGVVIATCCSLGYSVVLRPLQYYKIINRKAKGIWDA